MFKMAMAKANNKELKVFERLENMTKHESFDSAASFVRKFVNGNLDLNNTYQSIAEEEIEEEAKDEEKDESMSYCTEDSESEEHRSRLEAIIEELVEKENDEERNGDGTEEEDDSSEEYSEEEDEEEGCASPISKSGLLGRLVGPGKGQYNTGQLLLAEIKRSLELQEVQLARERKAFAEEKCSEQNQITNEKKQIETQRKGLQRLITDYHKIKSAKSEHEDKIKELTDKLRETKLEMSKRISRWGDQQRKLEDRVKALENENAELKKPKSTYKPTALKRPPLVVTQVNKGKLEMKQPKRIHFADDVSNKSQPSTSTTSLTPPPSENSQSMNSSSNSEAERRPNSPKEVCIASDNDSDKTMPSDYVEITHPCGTITRIAKDGKLTRHVMPNKDIMDEFYDCSVRYYYAELRYSQTTYPSGDEMIEHDSGILETHRADGSKIYTFVDGLVKIVDKSGLEEIFFVDGSTMKKDPSGECIITWPSGQKEIRNSTFVKRLYTNGTTKIKYRDGSEETRYWNGRVRRKDKNGKLVDDTKRQKQKLDKVNKTV